MIQGFLPKKMFILVLAGFLTACSGGGGGGSSLIGDNTGDSSGGTTTTTLPTLSVTIIDNAGAVVTSVNGSETAIVRAVFLNADGEAVSGAIVSFGVSTFGQLSPDSGTAVTDAAGAAEITLGSGTVEGAGTVSAEATVDDVTVTAISPAFSTDGQGDNVGSANFAVTLVLTTSDGSQTLSRSNPGTVTVTLTDSDNPTDTSNTDGALVEFSVSGGIGELAANAAFISGNTATMTLLAGISPGSAQLSATITAGGETLQADTVNFISNGDSVATVVLSAPGSISLAPTQSVSSLSSAVDNANPVTVTATVTDRLNTLLPGVIVNFSLSGDGRLGRNTHRTNINGQATTTLLAGTTEGSGEISATATVDGQSVSSGAGNEVSFDTLGDEPFSGEGTSNLTIAIGLDTDGDQADEGESKIDAELPGVLFAKVTLADGNPDVGRIVQFTLNGGVGDLFPANGQTLTDANGIATAALTAGSVPGAGTATAAIVINGATFNSTSLPFDSLGNAGDAVIVITTLFNDATPGNGSNIITSSEPAIISILVEDDSGTNLANRSTIVTTSLGTVSIGIGTPAATATAITDASGRVEVNLTAAGVTSGTGSVAVTVGDTTEIIQFDVGVDGLQIGICNGGTDATDCSPGTTTFIAGDLDVSISPLQAGGTATISLVIVDASQLVVQDIEIAFSTLCADLNPALAQISGTLTSDSSGVVTATYVDASCARTDVITATEASTGLTATGTIDVLPAKIGSIQFVSVTPQNIEIKGAGIQSASVVFRVLDDRTEAVEGARVDFELTTTIGGLSLDSTSGVTDSSGEVSTSVNSGFIPTTVRVRARVDVDGNSDGDTTDPEDFTLETLSDGLSVNTGVPDQNSMSISASRQNIEGEGFDGETTSITVSLADAFNNLVPDDTTVNFLTEYGAVQANCKTVAGVCSVTLRSQEPRRPLDPNTPVKSLLSDSCPTELIIDETVTVAVSAVATDAITDYVPADVLRVENTSDTVLVETTDYTVQSDGIECVPGRVICTGTGSLRISYNRLFLDEVGNPTQSATSAGIPDGNDPNLPALTNPGVGTRPFVARTGVPCQAAFRQATAAASQYRGGLGQRYGGRTTVLATSQGEESFVDSNGNGLYDFNEPFVDLTEAFVDENEDDVFGNGTPGTDDSRNAALPTCYGPVSPITLPGQVLDKCFQIGGNEEEPTDFNENGLFDAGNGIYNGTLCPDAISQRTDTCDNNADPCDEATERFCTRTVGNIRRDIVIVFSDSDAFFGVRDALTGEYIGSVDISGTPGTGLFSTNVGLTTNDGTAVGAGTAFSIGHGDGQVAPGIGESVSLTSGNSGVLVDISDQFNGRMSAGTGIAVTVGADGCLISNSPGTTVTDSSGLGFTTIFISLASQTNPVNGSSAVAVTATSSKGIGTQRSFTCTF